MADAFGDDLFSVFDEEQTSSTKKKPPIPEKGYVSYGFSFGSKVIFNS